MGTFAGPKFVDLVSALLLAGVVSLFGCDSSGSPSTVEARQSELRLDRKEAEDCCHRQFRPGRDRERCLDDCAHGRFNHGCGMRRDAGVHDAARDAGDATSADAAPASSSHHHLGGTAFGGPLRLQRCLGHGHRCGPQSRRCPHLQLDHHRRHADADGLDGQHARSVLRVHQRRPADHLDCGLERQPAAPAPPSPSTASPNVGTTSSSPAKTVIRRIRSPTAASSVTAPATSSGPAATARSIRASNATRQAPGAAAPTVRGPRSAATEFSDRASSATRPIKVPTEFSAGRAASSSPAATARSIRASSAIRRGLWLE